MRLLPCHFLVLSHSFTLMPSCEFRTSHPRSAPQLTPSTHAGVTVPLWWHASFISAVVVLPLQICVTVLFAGDDERCSSVPLILSSFLTFFFSLPSADAGWRNAKRCAFWHHLRRALVRYYPQFTVQRCSLIQTDSLVAPTQFICNNKGGRRFIIIWWLTIAYTVISEMDGSRCGGESASVTLHTPPEPQTKLPTHSCSAWFIAPPPPQGGAVHLQLKCVAGCRCY